MLSKYQEIFSNNPEWGRIEYLLQISYGNVSLNLTKIYSIGKFLYKARQLQPGDQVHEQELRQDHHRLRNLRRPAEKGGRLRIDLLKGHEKHAELQLRRTRPAKSFQISLRLLLSHDRPLRHRQNIHFPDKKHHRQHPLRLKALTDGQRIRLTFLV